MKINGKDIRFEYTIGAFCDYSDYCAAHPDVSMIRAEMYQALFMNRAYAELHPGAETVTLEEMMHLPQADFAELAKEIKSAEAAGSKRSVESVEKKQEKEKTSL